MNEVRDQLISLQHGDSFFPSGAVAFSYGLETLAQDGLVGNPEDVEGFLSDQIRHRWASSERAILSAAWGAALDISALMRVDQIQEALTLSRELREGSQRSGAALLSVHKSLATPGAKEFSERIVRGETHGHLAVVQGLVWQGVDQNLLQCTLLSAHTLCVAILGAALRLGLIGHLAAQRILVAMHPIIEELLKTAAPDLDQARAYTPLAEIAVMRHENQPTRLFSN